MSSIRRPRIIIDWQYLPGRSLPTNASINDRLTINDAWTLGNACWLQGTIRELFAETIGLFGMKCNWNYSYVEMELFGEPRVQELCILYEKFLDNYLRENGKERSGRLLRSNAAHGCSTIKNILFLLLTFRCWGEREEARSTSSSAVKIIVAENSVPGMLVAISLPPHSRPYKLCFSGSKLRTFL